LRSIRGRIVRYDALEIPKVLGEDRIQSVGEVSLTIVDRQADTYERSHDETLGKETGPSTVAHILLAFKAANALASGILEPLIRSWASSKA